MRKKQTKKIIAGSILAVLCAGLIFGLTIKTKDEQIAFEQSPKEIVVEEQKSVKSVENVDVQKPEIKNTSTSSPVSFAKKATFKVGGEEFVIQVSEQITIYDAMNSLMSEGYITFEGKQYSGLGFFVTQINSLQSGDGKNLMYYINGEEASSGVSTYVVKEGDIIEWKLK